jgi:hypothetical protein
MTCLNEYVTMSSEKEKMMGLLLYNPIIWKKW